MSNTNMANEPLNYEYHYVAQPYSHKDPEIMEQRYLLGCSYVRQALLEGIVPYAPIVHWHGVQKLYGAEFPSEFEYWKIADLTMVHKAKSLHVLLIPGWLTSVGLKAEIGFAQEHGIPIEQFKLQEDDTWKKIA